MNRKELKVDFIELHILHHAAEEPLYGLWMIEELAGHGYKTGPSQLYPKLHRLARKGLLRSSDRVVDGKRRRYYRITAEGRRYLERQRRRLAELVSEALTREQIEEAFRRRAARAGKHGRDR